MKPTKSYIDSGWRYTEEGVIFQERFRDVKGIYYAAKYSAVSYKTSLSWGNNGGTGSR